MASPPSALTIAGSDPTGGAGLQGDLKTFAAHGVVGSAVVTAITVQGAAGVRRVQGLDAGLVGDQLSAALVELRPRAVKTGMLWSAEVVRVVAARLRERPGFALVVDPILSATSGGNLLVQEALPVLRDLLIPLADVLTPNLPEAAALLGVSEIPATEYEEAARALLRLGSKSVLLKGGHAQGPESVDLLATGRSVTPLALRRLPGGPLHGTGCALSASLTARMARGHVLIEAVRGAKTYVHRAMQEALRRGPGRNVAHDVPA